EVALTIIEEQLVRLAIFKEMAVDHEQPITEPRRHDEFPIDHVNVYLAAIANIFGSIVRDVEIKRTVAIDVRQSHGHAARLAERSRGGAQVFEMAVAIIFETKHTLAGRGDEQIDETIAVDISEHRTSIILNRERQSGLARDVFEFPAAEVLEKRVW